MEKVLIELAIERRGELYFASAQISGKAEPNPGDVVGPFETLAEAEAAVEKMRRNLAKAIGAVEVPGGRAN